MRPISVFIGSSTAAKPIAEVVTSVLGGTFSCSPWWTVFPPSTFTLEALEVARRDHRFAVFIGRADDILLRHGREEDRAPVVRDNVIAEFLMFVGAHGRDHAYLLIDITSVPKLPSDLDGLVYTTYDAEEFARDPNGALSDACNRIVRRITEVNDLDLQQERALEAAALTVTNAEYIAELGELAYLLRDIIDAVQTDTLGALFDENKFADIKRAAAVRIDELCRPYEQKAASAHVLDEFMRLKEAVARTVSALPFPKDVFTGIDEAKSVYGQSAYGSVEPLVAAVQRQDWATALRIGLGMRDKLSMEAVAQQIAIIMDDRLHRLKGSYSNWWKGASRALTQRLNEFQRALLRAQTRLALRGKDE